MKSKKGNNIQINITPANSMGILYDTDQRIYKKSVYKLLKNAGADRTLLKSVKAMDKDLEIGKFLIENDLIDIMVFVYSTTDASFVIRACISENQFSREKEKVVMNSYEDACQRKKILLRGEIDRLNLEMETLRGQTYFVES